MPFSQHSRRPTSTMRNSQPADLTHRLETNQCALSVYTRPFTFSHFIFKRCWFDCGNLILSPSNLDLFVLKKFNKVHFAVCFQQRKLCHGTPVNTGPLSWRKRHRKALMAHARARAHKHTPLLGVQHNGWHPCLTFGKSISAWSERCLLAPDANTKKQRTVCC